jgi:hypothetical protein
MTRDDYERQKSLLEEQLRAGVELLEAAFRHQLRALDLVWAATGGEPVAVPRIPEVPALPTAPVPPAPPPPARRRAGQLQEEIENALRSVPEVFDRRDVCRALGYEPDRGSLYRELEILVQEGALAVKSPGTGNQPKRYRKTLAGSPESIG